MYTHIHTLRDTRATRGPRKVVQRKNLLSGSRNRSFRGKSKSPPGFPPGDVSRAGKAFSPKRIARQSRIEGRWRTRAERGGWDKANVGRMGRGRGKGTRFTIFPVHQA